MDKSEKKSGGAREGSGRPRQFKEPTTINFKCELSDKLKAKKKYGKSLNQMFIEWLKSII
ncbi:MAG TPA: hypothetical protein VN726_20435 [Hanamia sp.]|nr:hypothetical protein [Hanamia sp.]